MSLLTWTTKMSVGNEALDKDNRVFLDIVNRVHAVVRKKADHGSLIEVFDELDTYTEYHFNTEEQLLKMLRFSELDPHRDLHVGLRARTAEFRKKYEHDPDKFQVLPFFDFLCDWWMRHVLREDMKYSDDMLKARERAAKRNASKT
ncbi:MAG: bacteriohemerythrin [Rhodospirillaceae bacterium]